MRNAKTNGTKTSATDDRVTLPNFLIVGAAKSGTTALYHYLKQHPQVYMNADKETNFFAFEGQEVGFCGPGDERISRSAITNLEAYAREFEGASGEEAIGEASPWYLYSPHAAANIRRRVPGAKLLAVLRNPVDRAFSSYLHVVRDGRESLSFEESLRHETERIERGWEFIWHYRRAGFYSAQIERYLNLFPQDQVRIYLYDDLLRDPVGFLENVYEFLGVDTGFGVDTSFKPNATGVPKNRLLGGLLVRPNPLRSAVKPFLPKQFRYAVSQRINQRLLTKPSLRTETRKQLLREYAKEIPMLEDLIGRDLSTWKLQ